MDMVKDLLKTENIQHAADIREILGGNVQITPPDNGVCCAIRNNWDNVAKPLDGLGKFEELTARIGAAAGKTELNIDKKAILVMCADNGVVEEGVSQSGQDITLAVARSMGRQRSSVCRMGRAVHADVIPADIGINSSEDIPGVLNCKVSMGTRNIAKQEAMTEDEMFRAMQTGMDLVYTLKCQGYRIIGTGEMGIGNTTTSCAVIAGILGLSAWEITGRGAGLDDAGLQNKIRVIDRVIALHDLYNITAPEVVRRAGGLDIAALCGIMLSGALYHVPIVLDGVITLAAALAAERICPAVKGFLIASHTGREPAAATVIEELGLDAVITADMAIGEGCGAALLFALIDTVLPLYSDRATFEEIQIDPYVRWK